MSCVEKEEREYDDQNQLKEEKVEVADDPFRGIVVPLTDLIHKILKAHSYLPLLINSTSIHSPRNKEFGILRILIFLFVFFALTAGADAAERVRVHFISVGYADAILVQWLPGDAVLVDAGDAEDAPAILDYLESVGVSELAAIVITHPHKNHFGSAQIIAERLKVGRVFVNGDVNGEEGYSGLLKFFEDKGIPVANLQAGESLLGMPEDVSWEILHPRELSEDVNGNSLVSLIRFRETSFLLTGDIMLPAQEKLLKDNPSLRDVECVQIPHHGGPLSADFLSFFPKARFVVSTGENPWGLPDEKALAKAAGKVFRTDIDGTVIAESNGKEIEFTAVNDDRH